MSILRALGLVVSAGLLVLGGCKSSVEKPVSKCQLDMSKVGPMRRLGRARVRIAGDDLSIDAPDVKILCGPMFNQDVPKLGAVAGQGLLLETCLPEGLLQLSSYDRSLGKQAVHGVGQPGGTEVLFNKNGGSTYSTRADATDKIVLSSEMWKASAEVTLYDVATSDKLHVSLSIDCSTPSALAPRK